MLGGVVGGGGNADKEKYAHRVGSLKANQWGFNDMHGNVSEWCRDRYSKELLGGIDPLGSGSSSEYVVRGGGWIIGRIGVGAAECRCAARTKAEPLVQFGHHGFRVALVSTEKNSPAPVVLPVAPPVPMPTEGTKGTTTKNVPAPVVLPLATDPTKNGLLAEFFAGADFDRRTNERIESQINTKLWKGWADGMVRPGKFTVRWTGSIKAPTPDNYELIAESDDGARVWIDEKLVVDDWTAHAQRKKVGLFRFDKKPHTIKVEFWESFTGSYFMQLRWRRRNETSDVIPESAFFQPPNRSP